MTLKIYDPTQVRASKQGKYALTSSEQDVSVQWQGDPAGSGYNSRRP